MEFIKTENPDVICIQETKANQEQVELDLQEYNQYWNSAEKPGYSGTLILTPLANASKQELVCNVFAMSQLTT